MNFSHNLLGRPLRDPQAARNIPKLRIILESKRNLAQKQGPRKLKKSCCHQRRIALLNDETLNKVLVIRSLIYVPFSSIKSFTINKTFSTTLGSSFKDFIEPFFHRCLPVRERIFFCCEKLRNF